MRFGDKVYYSDELNDEAIDFKIEKMKIDKDYKYIHKNIFYRFFSFITYRLLATPIAWFYYKIIRGVKFKNKKVLKKHKKGGYFIYANHTMQMGDAFCPTLINFPKKPGVIVNSANVSLPFWGKVLRMWGAIPLPDTVDATRNFYEAIEDYLNHSNPVVIYPEAHLWPYYTKIRPFTHLSFRYPVKYNKPVYTFTTTYHKRKLGKKPAVEIYVDGPFYVDTSIPPKDAQAKLRDEVFNQLVERAKLSNYEFITYEKRSTND